MMTTGLDLRRPDIAEAFSIGLAVYGQGRREAPEWLDMLGGGLLDPVMAVLARALPRHGRLVLDPLPEELVEDILVAMAGGPFEPEAVINAVRCVASHAHVGGRTMCPRLHNRPESWQLVQRVTWWSLHDLAFLSCQATRLWTDGLDDGELATALSVCGDLVRGQVLSCLDPERVTRLRASTTGSPADREIAEHILHQALGRVVLAVEGNAVPAPLASLDTLPRADVTTIEARPWPEGRRDDSLARAAGELKRALFGGGEPATEHVALAADWLAFGPGRDQAQVLAALSDIVRVRLMPLTH